MSDNIMQQHPVTPPPELVQQWVYEYLKSSEVGTSPDHIATRAAQWGADCELEACCKMLYDRYDRVRHATGFPGSDMSDWLRAGRRSKPPSLKEQALQALNDAVKMADDAPPEGICSDQADIIRRALEHLPD